jgi:SAM-dependent methyltransferase
MWGKIIKRILRKTVGIEVRRLRAVAGEEQGVRGYVDAARTIAAAEAAGQSVSEYLETLWGTRGGAEKTIKKIIDQGAVFPGANVLEIGAGSGRYAECIYKFCPPRRYESYEPDKIWAAWLTGKYGLISQYTDGSHLASTPDAETDLVCAHGVFVYIPFINVVRYFGEIVRVLRRGGYCVFDAFTEICLEDGKLSAWLDSGHNYPAMLPAEFIRKWFVEHGFDIVFEFQAAYGVGVSHYFILRKGAHA